MSEKKKEKGKTGATIRFMLRTAGKQKPLIFLWYLLPALTSFLQTMVNVVSTKYLMDELIRILAGEAAGEHLPAVTGYAALIIGSNLLGNLLASAANQIKGTYAEWFNEYFEVELSRQIMGMDYEHTEDPEALDQMNKAREGLSWYSGGVVGVLNEFFNIFSNLIKIGGVVTIIAMTCPLLLPVQVLSLAAIMFFTNRKNGLELDAFKKLSKVNRGFGYVFYQLSNPENGKETRLFDSADMMCRKAEGYAEKMAGDLGRLSRKEVRFNWGSDAVNALRDGISYFYIGYRALRGAITIGDFTMCVSAASTLYGSMFQVVNGIAELLKKSNYAYEYLKFRELPEAMEKGSREVPAGEHVIEFKNVGFRYPRGEADVLKGVNLTIRQGEHLSIVGLNGAGKTTLVKLLCRMYDVTEGEILIDGINIREYSEKAYRRLFAVVFQDFCLFAFSLRENIVLDEAEDEERLWDTLSMAGLKEDAGKLSQGLDTTIFKGYDENGTVLSGGQQQKTAICRALYRNSPIVILDEPTAALDPIAEYEIYRRFDELVGGKTAIYISHRLSSCRFCDRIAVFAEDTLKEYGTHEELVTKPGGIYAEMYAAQAQYYVKNA